MDYEKVSLGRMAVFLLPSLKLKLRRQADGRTVEEHVHQFLLSHFDGYTAATGNIHGWWRNRGEEHYGEHREFKVAFAGKDRIAVLEGFLADVAVEICEQTIYIETGEDAWLIVPKRPEKG
jgi:hypothetical protein